jgi:hypothetical protein
VAEQVSTRSLMEKLGVKPESRVSLLGVKDAGFVADLERAGADVSRRRRKDSDLLFLAVESQDDLLRLAEVESSMARNGAVWAVFPRGRRDLRDVDVIRAGVGAGLVDNKVVRFSDSQTALRFVIPLSRR